MKIIDLLKKDAIALNVSLDSKQEAIDKLADEIVGLMETPW